MTEPIDPLEALARAFDKEDAAQRGEPDPWNTSVTGDDSPDWKGERMACALAGLQAYLAARSSNVGRTLLDFQPAATPPEIDAGTMLSLLVLAEDGGERYVLPAYYLNAAPLLREQCVCVDGETHDPAAGCPTSGWYYDQSNPEFEHCLYPIEGAVLAWTPLPSPEGVSW